MYIWNHRSFEWKGQNVDVVSSKKKTNKSSSTVSIDRHVSRRNIRSKIVARVLSFFFSSFFLFSFRFQNFDCESDEIFLFSLFLWEIADEEDYFPPSIRFHRCIFVSRFDRRAILGFPQLARIAIGDIAHEPAFKNRSKNRVNPNHERNVIVKK